MFPDTIETPKPAGPREVGHCMLQPTGYFYTEMKEHLWCTAWCALHLIHLPPMLVPHKQLCNSSTLVGTLAWHAAGDVAQMCLRCLGKLAG